MIVSNATTMYNRRLGCSQRRRALTPRSQLVVLAALLMCLSHHTATTRSTICLLFSNIDETGRDVHEEGIVHHGPVQFANNDENAFSWDSVDFNVRASCGYDKCYWPNSSSNTSNALGYLIAAEGNYDRMRQAQDLAATLHHTCGIQHLYYDDAPLVLVNVTSTRMRQLDRLTYNPARAANADNKSPFVFYLEDHCVAVQTVRAAPRDHLLFGGSLGDKWEAMQKEVIGFHRKRTTLSVFDFQDRLRRERARLECALRHQKGYWYDFQGLIDLKGNLYHMDLDGQFSHKKSVSDEMNAKQSQEVLEAQRQRNCRIGKILEYYSYQAREQELYVLSSLVSK